MCVSTERTKIQQTLFSQIRDFVSVYVCPSSQNGEQGMENCYLLRTDCPKYEVIYSDVGTSKP